MRMYIYTATQIITNEKIKGEIEASSQIEAKQKLLDNNLYVKYIRQKSILDLEIFPKSAISKESLMFMFEELLAILQTGINLYEGLLLIKSSKHSKEVNNLASKLIAYVSKGNSLSYSLEQINSIPAFIIGAIKSGEYGGNLEQTLSIIINQLKTEIEAKKKIRQVLIYPTIVVITLIISCIFAINFIFPQLLDMFTNQDNLPTITIVFISIVNFIQSNNLLLLTIPILLFLLFTLLNSTLQGKVFLESIYINLKLYKLYRNTEIANWLGLLISSGVTLTDALEVLQKSTTSVLLKMSLEHSKLEMSEGKYFSDTLHGNKLISSYLFSIIKTGENSGKLGQLLLKTGGYFDKTYSQQLQQLVVWIEPIITLVISLIVAFVVMAIILPTLTLSIQF